MNHHANTLPPPIPPLQMSANGPIAHDLSQNLNRSTLTSVTIMSAVDNSIMNSLSIPAVSLWIYRHRKSWLHRRARQCLRLLHGINYRQPTPNDARHRLHLLLRLLRQQISLRLHHRLLQHLHHPRRMSFFIFSNP